MIRKRVKVLAGVIALFIVATGFFLQRELQDIKMHAAHAQWQAKRLSDLVQKDESWLNLAGLFWMEEGTWTIGSGSQNDFVLREGNAPAELGTFIREEDSISFTPNADAQISVDGEPVTEQLVLEDDGGNEGDATVLSAGQLQWWIIARDGLLGVRVRNLKSAHLENFTGIESFSFDEGWQMEAQFLPFETPRQFEYPTILGTMRQEEAPGILVFEKEGRQFEMVPFERMGGGQLFLVFGDQTNGSQTYDGGRFLYVDMPDELGKTVIDFNRAYNPPCAFSPYSTCPQPLRQNRLPFAVEAGERVYEKPESLADVSPY